MIRSMTAFGRARVDTPEVSVTVEMKSVNSRFFDCTVKMPRQLSALEEKIKAYIQKKAVSRAKVDVYVTVTRHTQPAGSVALDLGYAESYIAALRRLGEEFGLADDISIMTVARNSEIFRTEGAEYDMEEEWERLRAVLDLAISDYVAMRTEEGRKAEEDLRGKLAHVAELVSEIEAISHEDTVGYRDKLEARLRQILGENAVTVDENRLLTECAVWADKIAIDEELVRLRSHFGAFIDIASSGEPSGRKLDFLMQELNRETNTIGSKANNARIARIVVDVKGELEKMREQIQNIE